MATCDFLILGDTHLGKLETYIKGDFNKPQMLVMDRVYKHAVANNIQHIIQTGDVHDFALPPQRTVARLASFLNKRDKVNWWFNVGNHDWSNVDHNSMQIQRLLGGGHTGFMPHVRVFDRPELVDIDGVPFFFVPHPHAFGPKEETICIGHFDVRGAQRDNGSVTEEGVDPRTLGPGFWYIGHMHKYQELKRMVYVGTPLQLSFGELPPKGFLQCTATYKNHSISSDYRFIPLQQPYSLHTVSINGEQLDKELLQVESDETKLYRLLIKKGVVLPDNFLAEHPNVIKWSPFKTESEREEIEKGGLVIGATHFDVTPTRGLNLFLRNEGLTKHKRARAREIMSEVMRELS
jgi:DNA repair exonuclease SbcCD nuclease subunit